MSQGFDWVLGTWNIDLALLLQPIDAQQSCPSVCLDMVSFEMGELGASVRWRYFFLLGSPPGLCTWAGVILHRVARRVSPFYNVGALAVALRAIHLSLEI